MRILRLLLLSIFFLMLGGSELLAQMPDPIGPFAADARVAIPRFKEDANVASALGVSSANLPARGFGLAGGAHWYPVRMGHVTLGFGGEVLMSRASNTLKSDDDDGVDGPTVNTRFSVITPQVSLNFGTRRGWSYLSGGLGWGSFKTERADAPVADAAFRPRVLNYGGGARWFAKEHLAFALDLRFYAVNAQAAGSGRPAYPSMTLMVFSAGVAIK